MIGWKSTSVALSNLEELLICKICGNLVNDPCSLEACDHFFCRNCVQRVVGTKSKCPECGAFSWIKDLKTNRQLASTVSLCIGIRHIVRKRDDNENLISGGMGDDMSSNADVIWENTDQIPEDENDTYVFPSPSSETVDCDTWLQRTEERVMGELCMVTQLSPAEQSCKPVTYSSRDVDNLRDTQESKTPLTDGTMQRISRSSHDLDTKVATLKTSQQATESPADHMHLNCSDNIVINKLEVGNSNCSSRVLKKENKVSSKPETMVEVSTSLGNDTCSSKTPVNKKRQGKGSKKSKKQMKCLTINANKYKDEVQTIPEIPVPVAEHLDDRLEGCSEISLVKNVSDADLNGLVHVLKIRGDSRVVHVNEDTGIVKSNKKYTMIKSNLVKKCQPNYVGRTEGDITPVKRTGDQTRTRAQKRKQPHEETTAAAVIQVDTSSQFKDMDDECERRSNTTSRKRMKKSEQSKICPGTHITDYMVTESECNHPSSPFAMEDKTSDLGKCSSPRNFQIISPLPTTSSPYASKITSSKGTGMSSPLLTRRNKRGEAQLHVAAIKGLIEDVRYLLEQGADPNARDHAGWTPLHEACNHGHVAIAKLLLDSGALIDIPGGFDHDTPLHDAVVNNRVDISRLLLARGAPLNMRNKQGMLPADCARTDLMQFLLRDAATAMHSSEANNVCRGMALANLPQSGFETSKVLLSTGLSGEQKEKLQKCIKTLGGKVVDEFSTAVTHVVTAASTQGVCPRTMKFLSGVLNGKWVLTFGWISKCLKIKKWEEEEPFQVKGTYDAQVDAPNRARINALKKLPRLFDGCSFYIFGNFDSATPSKEEITQLIKYGGGKILSREPKAEVDDMLRLPSRDSKAKPQMIALPTVVYHARPDSPQYWCTNYVIYDPLSDRKPRILKTHQLCSVPVTWLLGCVSHFGILDVTQE